MELDGDYWTVTTVSIAISVFLIFLLWDFAYSWVTIKRCRRDLYLVPNNVLVMLATFIVTMRYSHILNVNEFGERRHEEFTELFHKQLGIDVFRLVVCVLAAYVLPSMAVDSSGQRGPMLVFLVLSFAFQDGGSKNLHNVKKESNQDGDWFISSSIIFSVAAICLVLYLGMSVLWGKVLYKDLCYRILETISELNLRNEADYYKSKAFENEILKLWVVAKAWEGQYVLSSSELSPGAAGILTIYMAVLLAKVASNASLVYDVVGLSFYLQCLFIVTGFVLIFLRLTVSFWSRQRHYVVLKGTVEFVKFVRKYMELALNSRYILNEKYGECIKRPILTIIEIIFWIMLVTIVLPLIIVFVVPISLLLLFNYSCWKLFFLVLGDKQESPDLEDAVLGGKQGSPDQEDAEFLKYKILLKEIIREEGDYLIYFWKSNIKSFEGVKKSMETACSKFQSRNNFFNQIRSSVAQNLPQHEGTDLEEFIAQNHPRLKNKGLEFYKENAVMVIRMIVELRDKYGCNFDFDPEDLIKAYEQVKDLLEFAVRPDNINIGLLKLFSKEDSLRHRSLQSDKMLLDVKRSLEIPRQLRPQQTTLDDIRHHLLFSPGWMPFERRWADEVIAYGSYTNESELLSALVSFLKEIIECCVLQLPDLIMKCCKRWAEEFRADNIAIACEVAAKLDAIMNIDNTDTEFP